MYSQFLYFIIALLLVTMHRPASQAALPPLLTAACSLGIFAVYWLICRVVFRRAGSAISAGRSQALASLKYYRAQTWLSILALLCLAVYIYVLDIKHYVPILDHSLTAAGLAGTAVFVAHLSVMWACSHSVHRHIHRSDIGRAAFIRANISFSSAVLIPWFVVSFISDLLQMVSKPAFMESEAGQIVMFALILIACVFLAPGLVVRMWGCSPLPSNSIRAELEEFCREHRFKVGDFKLWPLPGGETLTAGIIGILPRLRYILITRGLIELLTLEELKAVVAHEIGHVRRFHLLLYLVFFMFYSFLVYNLGDLLLLFLLKQRSILGWALSGNAFETALFSLAYTLPVIALLVIFFRFVFGYFLRNSERQADLYASDLVGHPFTLISSLQKIAFSSGRVEDLPNWHHYSIRQRVEFLLDSYRDKDLALRHHRRLYGSSLLYVLAVTLLILGTTGLENTALFRKWKTDLQMGMIEQRINKRPEDFQLRSAYGGLLLEMGRYDEAEEALLKALSLAPEDAGTLNNLAWFYATSPEPYANAGEALELASKAASLKPDPYILDTLAEAYFVNGRYREAIEAIDMAIAKTSENRDYYLKQKRKFEEALRESGGKSGGLPGGEELQVRVPERNGNGPNPLRSREVRAG